MKICIYYDETDFRVKGWRKTKSLVSEIINQDRKTAGDISFIITDDSELRKINSEFLGHDYFTDVITFDYSNGNTLNGEIYISIDTVRSNAILYNTGIQEEMKRVIIHGILHIIGYDDKASNERRIMKEAEDKWLDSLESLFK